MAITIMCDPGDPGATLSPEWSRRCQHEDRSSLIWLRTFAVGKVVALRERNGYDDSDFYATYLGEDGGFHETQYATTRGWTYPNGASVDATPEIHAAYRRHLDGIERRRREESARIQAAKDAAAMSKARLSAAEFSDLAAAYQGRTLESVLALLTVRNFRSEFRKSLAAQLRQWLATPAEQRDHPTPLSRRQLEAVCRF